MPTQQAIADHLGLDQSAVSKQMQGLALDWRKATMTEIRLAYCAHMRAVAAGHKSEDGLDLTRERAMTEQVDREIKMLTLAEKRAQLVNVTQLEPELVQMVVSFRAELLARDDRIKSDLDALYGIDVDLQVLNDATYDALQQLARYDPEQQGTGASAGGSAGAAAQDDDDGMGEGTPPAVA
jgi:hypothetical protein